MNNRTAAQWFQDPKLHATSAIALLLDIYGTEFLDWDPTTISLEMRGRFGQEPDDELFDRLMSGIALLKSNAFFVDIQAFMDICNAFNFGVVMSNTWIPADLDDVLWGVTEARMLLGDEFNEDDFSHDVKRYVGMLLQEEGINKIPSVLSFAEIDDTVEETFESYEGDEVMEQAFWDTQQEDKAKMETRNQQQLVEYMEQVRSLPIASEFAEGLTPV